MEIRKGEDIIMKKKIQLFIGGIILIPFLAILGAALIVIGFAFPVVVLIERLTGGITDLMQKYIYESIEFTFTILNWNVPNQFQIIIGLLVGGCFFMFEKQLLNLLKRYLNQFSI